MDHEQIAEQAADAVRTVLAQAEVRAAEIINAAEERAAGIVARAEAEAPIPAPPSPSPDPSPIPPVPLPGPPDPQPPSIPEPGPDPVPEPFPGPDPGPPIPPVPDPGPPTPIDPDVAPAAASDARTGALLIGLKLATDGSPRDEIVARLDPVLSEDERGQIADLVLARATAKTA